jgi:hypothetical protein
VSWESFMEPAAMAIMPTISNVDKKLFMGGSF